MGNQQNTILSFIVLLALIGIIGGVTLYISEKVADKTALADATTASGTLTFTNGINDANLINISGIVFELNTTLPAASAQNVQVNVTGFTQGAAVTALVTAINANATTAALVTASNVSTNVYLLSDVSGSVGNILTWEDLTNASWTSTTLTGGVNADYYFNASGDVIDSVETGWDFTEIVVLAIATGIVLVAIIGALIATGVLRL